MRCSLRKVLNLTYTWLFDLIGGTEAWDKDYASVFDPNAGDEFDYVDLPVAPVMPGEEGAAPRSTLMFDGI